MGATTAQGKPDKPYPKFPLTPHSSGKWCKKIKGRIRYFGRWEDPDGALREYNAVKEILRLGHDPVATHPTNIDVRTLFNSYLLRQQSRVETGALEPGTYMDALTRLKQFAESVGPGRAVADLRPVDFSMARDGFGKSLGPHALNRAISNVRAAFRYGYKHGLIAEVVAGDGFDKDPQRMQRRAAREKVHARGKKLFTPEECRMLVDAAGIPMKAMILLGLNAGFYAVDVANLPITAIDFAAGRLEFARTKTETTRIAPLWPETIAALQQAIESRPAASNALDAKLVFITTWGNRWVQDTVHRNDTGITKVTRTDSVNQQFTKLLKGLGIRRPYINFSALRSTFRTVADELSDTNAVNLIMGHSFPGMDAFYVRYVNKKRLKAVTDHVRKALLLNSQKVRERRASKTAKRGDRHKRTR